MDHDFASPSSAVNEEKLSALTPAAASMSGRYGGEAMDLDGDSVPIYDYPPSVASSSMYGEALAYGSNSMPPVYGYPQPSASHPPYGTDDVNYPIPPHHHHSQQRWPSYAADYGNGAVPSASAQRMQMWSAHNAPASFFTPPGGQHDSGIHSMTHSSATSVMSSLHAPSQMSGVSSTDGGAAQLTDAQRARFHHIPTNIRQASPEQIRQTLPDLIPLLNDADEEEIALEALRILERIVDGCGDALTNSGACGSAVVGGIFHAMRTFRRNTATIRYAVRTLHKITSGPHHGVEFLIQQIDETNAKCLDEILNAIRLVSEPKVSPIVIRYVHETRALAQIVNLLEIPKFEQLTFRKEQFLCIVIVIVTSVVKMDGDQKSFFCALNGPSLLIHILKRANYHNLLKHAAKLLGIIANCQPRAVVESGALDGLHVQFGHPDRRVVRDLLSCLLNFSDVSVAGRDISALLLHLLHLFGDRRLGASRDETSIQHKSADLLSNFSANNPINKAFLVRHNVIGVSFNVLFTTETILRQGAAANQRSAEEIQDSVLTLLGNICTGHDLTQEAQCEIMRARPDGDIFLQKIAKKRVVLVRRTLRILCHTSANDACLERFRQLLAMPNGAPPIVPYVKEIVECFQLAAEYHDHAIEGVNMTDLVQDSMRILTNLCRDNFLLETIVSYLRHATISDGNTRQICLPQFALRQNKSHRKSLAFCAELARHPQASFWLSHDDTTINILNADAAQSDSSNCAANARRCLDWIYKHSTQNWNYYGTFLHNDSHIRFTPGSVDNTQHRAVPPLHNDLLNVREQEKYKHGQVYSRDQPYYTNEAYSQNCYRTPHNNHNYTADMPPAVPSHQGASSEIPETLPEHSTSSSSALQCQCVSPSRLTTDESRLSNNDSTGTLFADAGDCAETLDEYGEFGGAAARCSTPVDASALHATINLESGAGDAFNWDGADMSASTATIVDRDGSGGEIAAQSANFEQLNLYDEEFSIASAICGVSPQVS